MRATRAFAPAVRLACLAALLGACTVEPAAFPIAVFTEDEALPFVAVDEQGTVIAVHAEHVSGAPTGLTIFTADDRVGHLEIDHATGHPAFWQADGYVVTFSNLRAEQGLVDLGVITPDGSVGQALDFEIPPLAELGAASEPLSDAEAGSKWLEMLAALDAAVTLTGCVGGLIVTGGAAVGGAAVPVAAVPLFASPAANGAATADACATGVVKLRALRAANVHANAANDVVLGPIDLGRQVVVRRRAGRP